jgi:hypothetical protein
MNILIPFLSQTATTDLTLADNDTYITEYEFAFRQVQAKCCPNPIHYDC